MIAFDQRWGVGSGIYHEVEEVIGESMGRDVQTELVEIRVDEVATRGSVLGFLTGVEGSRVWE